MPTDQAQPDQAHELRERGIKVKGILTIQRDAMSLYEAWRHLSQLDRFLENLVEVQELDEKRSTWTVEGPIGKRMTWTAELIVDKPGEMLAWRTVGNPDVMTAGTIAFSELKNGRGTEVRVQLEYVPPGGKLGDAVAKAFQKDAKNQVLLGLLRFRQVMETGEVAVAKGQPVGKNARRHDRPGESDTRKTDPDVRDIADGSQPASHIEESRS